MTDEECWEDGVAQREEQRQNAEARVGANAPGGDGLAPDSPPAGRGAPRSRKSARIIAKVNAGRRTELQTSDERTRDRDQGHGKETLSLTGGRGGLTGGVQALSTVSPDLPPMKDAELKLTRNPRECR